MIGYWMTGGEGKYMLCMGRVVVWVGEVGEGENGEVVGDGVVVVCFGEAGEAEKKKEDV